MIEIAIKELNPNAVYNLKEYANGNYEIEWLNGTPEISKESINLKIEEVKIKYSYIEKRQRKYPSIQEQLDMQYWDKINNTDTWEQAINAVKAQYPKS
jgi:hypothetical protein